MRRGRWVDEKELMGYGKQSSRGEPNNAGKTCIDKSGMERIICYIQTMLLLLYNLLDLFFKYLVQYQKGHCLNQDQAIQNIGFKTLLSLYKCTAPTNSPQRENPVKSSQPQHHTIQNVNNSLLVKPLAIPT